MIEKLTVLPFTNKDTSVKESILMLDRNHKDKVNALPINFKISLFMIFLERNFIIWHLETKISYFVMILETGGFSKKKLVLV